jgi:hypothetical protein
MATVDRVSGDWYLTSLSGNIYIEASGGAGVTNILGDLVVIGRQTNLGSIETIISGHHFLMKKLGKGVFKLSVLYE